MSWSLDSLRANATLREWRFPSTVPIVGPLISALRRAVFSIASRWALLHVAEQQTAFNLRILDSLTAFEDRIQKLELRHQYSERLWADADRNLLQLRRDIAEWAIVTRRIQDSVRIGDSLGMDARLSNVERDVGDVIGVLLNVLQERREALPQAALSPASHEQMTPPVADVKLDYFLFETRYRGSTKEIARRHEKYLQFFQTKYTVLDLGCGRGEFLELLIQNGIIARGVDLDSDMVDYCRQRGLPVELRDAINFLEEFEDNSLGGIFMGQVVEHLPPDTLIHLIHVAHRKLIPDACFVAETINPMCLLALATHYLMDWSHVHPVHPETLRFVLQSAGFDTPTVLYSEPVPESVRLKRLPESDRLSPAEQEWVRIQNENLDRLNDFLYGNQDYSIVARKLAWPKRLASVASRRMLLVDK